MIFFLSDYFFQTKEMEQIKKFKCGNCNKPFKFKSILLLHSMKCNEISPEVQKNYLLDEETDNMKIRDGLRKPSRKTQKLKDIEYSVTENENSGKRYQCKKCEKSFSAFYMIHRHVYNVHKKVYHENPENLRPKCKICDKVFKNIWGMNHHLYQSHKERKFKCDKCSGMFPFKSNLEMHKCGNRIEHFGKNYKIIDSDKKIFQCNHCSKTFKKVNCVINHFYNVHMEESNARCKECSKVFKNQKLANLHFHRIHKHKFRCDNCHKTFPFSSMLKNHLNTCRHDRKYQCEKCERKFSTDKQIRQHIYNVHKEKKFRCSICHKKFPYISVLKRHSKTCESNKKSESQVKT